MTIDELNGLNEYNGLPIQEMFIADIPKMGIVSMPAIQVDANFYSETDDDDIEIPDEFKFSITSEDEMIMSGPAMIPNLLISRKGKYVFFSNETVRQAPLLFFGNNHQNSTSLEHYVDGYGNTVFESWIIEDPKMDKSVTLGYSDLPKDTWFISMKFKDKEIWNRYIKTRKLKGFSIEAIPDKIKNNNMLKLSDIKNFFMGKTVEEDIVKMSDNGGLVNSELGDKNGLSEDDSVMLVLEFTSELDGRPIKVDDMMKAIYSDDNSVVEKGSYSVRITNDETSIWSLDIAEDGKIIAMHTPWNMKKEVEEDKNKQEIQMEFNEEKFSAIQSENEVLKAEVEKFKAESDLVKADIEKFKAEIEAMKAIANEPVIVKSNVDKYAVEKDEKGIPTLDSILKNI